MTPGPHGRLVVNVCRGCLDRSAIYAGRVPRGWRAEGGAVWCRRCRKARHAAPQPRPGAFVAPDAPSHGPGAAPL